MGTKKGVDTLESDLAYAAKVAQGRQGKEWSGLGKLEESVHQDTKAESAREAKLELAQALKVEKDLPNEMSQTMQAAKKKIRNDEAQTELDSAALYKNAMQKVKNEDKARAATAAQYFNVESPRKVEAMQKAELERETDREMQHAMRTEKVKMEKDAADTTAETNAEYNKALKEQEKNAQERTESSASFY